MATKKFTAKWLSSVDASITKTDLKFDIQGSTDGTNFTDIAIDILGSSADVTFGTSGDTADDAVTIDNVDVGTTAWTDYRIRNKNGIEVSDWSAAYADTVVQYKIVSGVADNDRILFDAVERILLPPTENWEIEIDAKMQTTSALGGNATLLYGLLDVDAAQINFGPTGYFYITGVMKWTSSAQAVDGTIIASLDDGLRHTWKFSWTVGDSGIRLLVDDTHDFGIPDSGAAAPTGDMTIYNILSLTAAEGGELYGLKITQGLNVYDYELLEGSGTTLDYTGGTDHTINLTTDTPTDQDARMWQTV